MSDDITPPPPPPPGGTPPPPPPPSPYGSTPPPAGGAGYSPTDAIKYGWDKFTKAPTQLLIPTLIVAVVAIAVEVVLVLLLNATLLDTDCTVTSDANGLNFDGCDGPGFITRLFAYAILGFVISLFIQALGAGLIKSGLDVVDGKDVDAGQVFSYVTRPNVLVTAALVALATSIGSFLCYVPGIVVGYLTMFAMFYVVDKDMAPVEAIKASISLVTSKIGDTIVFALLAVVVLAVGAILCGVGLLAAIPVVLAASGYTYRRLQDQPVSPTS